MKEWFLVPFGLVLGFSIRFFTRKKVIKEDFVDESETGAVFVVRKDLGMRKGKIGAQVGHCSLGIFHVLTEKNPKLANKWREGKVKFWFRYCKSENELLSLESKGEELGKNTYIIQDAGRTQIEEGSLTVLGVAPVDENEVKIFEESTIIFK
jgi:PTH2 family peptidyl-tRNA hydrolase